MYIPGKAYEDAVLALQAEAFRVVSREGIGASVAYLRRLGEIESELRSRGALGSLRKPVGGFLGGGNYPGCLEFE